MATKQLSQELGRRLAHACLEEALAFYREVHDHECTICGGPIADQLDEDDVDDEELEDTEDDVLESQDELSTSFGAYDPHSELLFNAVIAVRGDQDGNITVKLK